MVQVIRTITCSDWLNSGKEIFLCWVREAGGHNVTVKKAGFLAFSNPELKMQFDVAKYGSKGFSPGT